MQIQSHDTARRTGIAIAGLALAVLLAVGAVTAASVASQPIHIDDPANESVEVTLDFAASTSATVELTDGQTIYDSTTVSGNTSISPVTATLSTGALENPANLTLNVDSPDATNVTITSTAIVKTTTVNVSDATNQSLIVDVGFAATANATATVSVTDSTGVALFNDTIAYDYTKYSDNQTVRTVSYNASDGLVDGDLTVEIAVSPASAYQSAYAQVSDGSTSTGGLVGGTIAGQSTTTVIAVIVILGAGYYAHREEYI